MPEADVPEILPIDNSGASEHVVVIPSELHGDPRRQAVTSIQGTVYQAWCSIDEWLRLSSPDQVIYLEGAEDFDVVTKDGARTVQVKHQSAPISLANKKMHKALENFWQLAGQDDARQVQFHYLTTGDIAKEQDASFDGMAGVDAWRIAHHNAQMAEKVLAYLVLKLDAQSVLRASLKTMKQCEFQEQVIRRIRWLTNQPDIDTVKKSVDDRISVLLYEQKRSTSFTQKVRKHLESRFWELVLEQVSRKRCLTLGDLLCQMEEATTILFPIPLEQIPSIRLRPSQHGRVCVRCSSHQHHRRFLEHRQAWHHRYIP